jgi:hypothetical protein
MVGWPVIRRPTVPTHAALDSVAVPVPATAIDQRRVLVHAAAVFPQSPNLCSPMATFAIVSTH